MVQAIINLGEMEDRVVTIVRGKFGLKNKSDAVNHIIRQYEEELLEPKFRPEFVREMKRIAKEKVFRYKDFAELERDLEHA